MSHTERDRLKFYLNGRELPANLLRKINEMYRMSAPRYRTGSGYWYAFRLDAKHWPKKGKQHTRSRIGAAGRPSAAGDFLCAT